MTTAAPAVRRLTPSGGGPLRRRLRRWTAAWAFTLLGLVAVSGFLMPLGYMVATSMKDAGQASDPTAPIYPAKPATFSYQGKDYPIYSVPTPDGVVHQWALFEPHRESSLFIDPSHPEAGTIQWQGRYRTLTQAWQLSLKLDNFSDAWGIINFGRLLFNTFGIAILGTIGTLLSSICVAYGFSRFKFPGKNGLFLLLLSTIILPFQVTLIPSFAVYSKLGWVGTWLPLIVPHFFANAYNVFLLRQFFTTIPREMDEAAMMDGASPFRVLTSIIIPQSLPAIVAVGLFHFFFAWNDFFLPLIYLQGHPESQPLSVGIANFNSLYSQQPTLIQASALMALIVPVVIFFLAQKAFMRGVVITGVDK
ncbi:MAG: multiple sugar transport system permease protein [Chloroflexota bacterium]|jgi:multiple sugar transport system permease protein|nr:multiple sugar transport system permease protein [Chloroflexota bacterium]